MNSRSDLGHTIPNRGLRFYNAKRYSGFDLGRPSYDQRHKNPPQSYTGHGGALVPHGGGLAGDSRAGAQMPQSPLLRVLREAQNIGNREGWFSPTIEVRSMLSTARGGFTAGMTRRRAISQCRRRAPPNAATNTRLRAPGSPRSPPRCARRQRPEACVRRRRSHSPSVMVATANWQRGSWFAKVGG